MAPRSVMEIIGRLVVCSLFAALLVFIAMTIRTVSAMLAAGPYCASIGGGC